MMQSISSSVCSFVGLSLLLRSGCVAAATKCVAHVSPRGKLTRREIYGCGGGLLVASTNASDLL